MWLTLDNDLVITAMKKEGMRRRDRWNAEGNACLGTVEGCSGGLMHYLELAIKIMDTRS